MLFDEIFNLCNRFQRKKCTLGLFLQRIYVSWVTIMMVNSRRMRSVVPEEDSLIATFNQLFDFQSINILFSGA